MYSTPPPGYLPGLVYFGTLTVCLAWRVGGKVVARLCIRFRKRRIPGKLKARVKPSQALPSGLPIHLSLALSYLTSPPATASHWPRPRSLRPTAPGRALPGPAPGDCGRVASGPRPAPSGPPGHRRWLPMASRHRRDSRKPPWPFRRFALPTSLPSPVWRGGTKGSVPVPPRPLHGPPRLPPGPPGARAPWPPTPQGPGARGPATAQT